MTNRKVLTIAALLSYALGTCQLAAAQDDRSPEPENQAGQSIPVDPALAPQVYKPKGKIIVPESSVARAEDAGLRVHTNHVIFVPDGAPTSSPTPTTYYFAETPASLGCVYGVGPTYAGCNPTTGGTKHPSGGWGAIAIVDAYDNPNASSDLAFFSTFYGLPTATFSKVYANTSFGTLNGMTASCGGTPAASTSWGVEEDLDIEWAHAMAPSARIILVEACSNSYTDMLFAEQVAGIQVDIYGGGEITNSWGSAEFSTEVGAYDDVFYRYHPNKISYFASAGDSGWGAQYPSSSPWVVSAGGTTIGRDISGNYVSETCWSGSGGGESAFELWQSPPDVENGMGPWSSFQQELFGAYPYNTAPRATPDISFDADPASGVNVYDTYGYAGWLVVGGTSVSSPALAGIVNNANNRLGQSGAGHYHTGENNLLYSQLLSYTAYPANFYDVSTGSNGVGHNAGIGYDECTGVGSPRGKKGK